jgi:hypothetical protein
MSAKCHKQTLEQALEMSASPPKADVLKVDSVRLVPITDVGLRGRDRSGMDDRLGWQSAAGTEQISVVIRIFRSVYGS